MDKEILDKYLKAGKIASEARGYGKSLIKVGASLLVRRQTCFSNSNIFK